MSSVQHHVIIVTTYRRDLAEEAWYVAEGIFPHATHPVESSVNGYFTFFIPPDGSKEGWADSVEGDQRRDEFITWLKSKDYSDGSNPYTWVEVSYGDHGPDVTRTNSENLIAP